MSNTGWWSQLDRYQAIDLGGRTLRISQPPHESVLSEPNVLVRNQKTGSIVAVGSEAENLRGRTPDHYEFIEPVKSGSIANPDAAITLLSHIMHRYRSWVESLIGQQFIVGVSPNISDTDVRTLTSVFNRIGSRSTKVVLNPVAALVGADIAVNDPFAQMVIDIGSDTTDISIVAKGKLIISDTINTAGRSIDNSIQNYMRDERNLHISSQQANRIKHKLAAVNEGEPDTDSMTVYGQDTASRLPRETSVTHQDINKAIQGVIDQLTSFIQTFLQSTSSDIAADVYTHGVQLVGGTAKLPGLANELAEALSISVYEHSQPDQVIIRGLGAVANEKRQYAELITDFATDESAN